MRGNSEGRVCFREGLAEGGAFGEDRKKRLDHRLSLINIARHTETSYMAPHGVLEDAPRAKGEKTEKPTKNRER